MGCCAQFCALLKKNVLIKRRQWGSTLFELILPAIIFLVLVLVKELLPPDSFDESQHLDYGIEFSQQDRFSALSSMVSKRNAKLGFYPQDKSQPIADYMTNNGFDSQNIMFFDNEDAMDDYVTQKNYGQIADIPYLHAVIHINDLDGPNYDYDLRFNSSAGNKYFSAPDPRESAYNWYSKEFQVTPFMAYDGMGFTLMQSIIDTFILTKEGVITWPAATPYNPKNYDNVVDLIQQPMPTVAYKKDLFTLIVADSLGFILTLIFIWPLSRIMSSLVEEKELKLKAMMKLMGLSSFSLIASWWLTYVIMFAIMSILICLCSFWGLYANSMIVYIFLVYFFFGLSVFSLAFFMSAFFTNAKTASTFGSIIFLCTFFVYFGVGETSTQGMQTGVCIIPTVCLSLTGNTLAELESLQEGATSSTVNEVIKGFSVSTGIGMLFFDAIFFFLLGLYFNQVVKSEYTISRPWYFLCLPSFWCGTRADRQSSVCGCCCTEEKPDIRLNTIDYLTANEGPGSKLQQSTKTETPFIQIRDLRKTYPSEDSSCCSKAPDFVAVKGVSLDIHLGSVYVLLGENGAGKSTTMSMLMGLVPSTSGEALINGYSLNNDIQKIYSQQGVCFQHDVLYSTLTVYEHMKLFGAIKKLVGDDETQHNEIMRLLNMVGLGPTGDNKLDAFPTELSGGQKRKLSLAIALLSDSRVLYLDEPSTGVDVASQRTIWDAIIASREGRVFIITTHSMEEAGSIGDQIGIFASGKLMCSGSPLYLKQQYGVGYSLAINKVAKEDANQQDDVLDDDYEGGGEYGSDEGNNKTALSPKLIAPVADDVHLTNIPRIDDDKADPVVVNDAQRSATQQEKAITVSTKSGKVIYDYITVRYPFALLATDTAGEISFRLPLSKAGEFPDLLDDLEHNSEALGIATYGMGVTSLTDVFLRAIYGQSREDLHEVELQQKYEEKMRLEGKTPDSSGAFESSGKGKKKNKLGNIDATWGHLTHDIQNLSNATIFWRHFWALFFKRFHYSKRDKKAMMWQLLYPGIILLAGCLALNFAVSSTFPTRSISGTIYPPGSYLTLGNAAAVGPEFTTVYDAIKTVAEGPLYNHVVDEVTDGTVADHATLQQWLLDTYWDRPFKQARFGALVIEQISNIPSTDPTIAPKLSASLHFNTTAPDALPVYKNLLHNALLATGTTPDASINTSSHPLPKTRRELTFVGSTVAFIICIAMSFVPASFAAFVVRERTDNIKHLQLVSGVSNFAYWASTMAWDLVNFVLPFLLFIIILFSFDLEPLMTASGIILTIVSLWLYVLASLPFTYCLSFLFNSHTSAQNLTLLINFLGSVVLLILSVMLSIIKSSREINKILRFFYRLIPAYALGDIFAMTMIRENIYPDSTSAWELHVAGWDLIFLAIDFFLFSGLLILLEHWNSNNILEWMKGGCRSIAADDDDRFVDPEEDSDVRDLRMGIQGGKFDDYQKYPIVLKGLRKVYPAVKKGKKPFLAAANVFLAVKMGECVSFLGANGSGKTTTLKMLSSDIYPSVPGSGDAFIGGFSIMNQSQSIRQLLGYVPQFDALSPLLTPREHLNMYASIKCIPKARIDGYVNFMLDKLGLGHLADRKAIALSGGNRRKLSLGIALIGMPRVLLLDEVSSGIDPSSRRILWSLISSTAKNRAVILTTHNLEEAEALSTNITIMASGRVRCYGSSLHLKNKFGKGLEIEIECHEGEQEIAKDWFTSTFPNGLVKIEEYRTTLRYAIPKENYHISNVFRQMENAKLSQKCGIQAYQCSQTSLDQIFIQFIREDDERRAKQGGDRT